MHFRLIFLCIFFFGIWSVVVEGSMKVLESTDIPYFVVVSSHFCGGILLNEHFVITPAYCVSRLLETTVFLGFHEAPNHMEEIPMQAIDGKVIVHEDYLEINAYRHFINNIALVKLLQPARLSDHVRPGIFISRYEQYRLEGEYVNISGWDREVNYRKTAAVQIKTQDQCRHILKDSFSPSQEFCIEYLVKTESSMNLQGNIATIDNKIIGYILPSIQCIRLHPECFPNYKILNIVPFFDWISNIVDIPIEYFTKA